MTKTVLTSIRDTPGVLARFDENWQERFATSPVRYGSLGRMTGEDLLDRVNVARRDAKTLDSLLHALMALVGPERHEGALHALVQVFRPLILSKASNVALRERTTGNSIRFVESLNATVALFWDVVMTYPLHRTQHVAGNVRGELLKAISRAYPTEVEANECPTAYETTSTDVYRELFTAEGAGSANAEALEAVMTVLDWARTHQVLNEEQIKLLGSYFTINGGREARQEMAQSEGITTKQLSHRVSKYTVVLRDAISEVGLTREAIAA